MEALTGLLRYGPGFVGLLVMLECMGLPLPGETAMVAAALYAAQTHRLSLWTLLGAASAGAVAGGAGGFVIGRTAGAWLLLRHGPRLGLSADRRLLGLYLMRNGGGALVLLGRFVPVLRAVAAILAGAAGMDWRRFAAYNLLGGMVWPSLYMLGAFTAGTAIRHLAGVAGIVAAAIGLVALAAAAMFVRRHERRLIDAARAARDRGDLDTAASSGNISSL